MTPERGQWIQEAIGEAAEPLLREVVACLAAL